MLTSTCTRPSRSPTAAASATHAASLDRSAGRATHSPTRDSSPATSSHTAAFRELTYTRAPPSTNPRAIINPIPRLPPVTTAVFPSTENRSPMPLLQLSTSTSLVLGLTAMLPQTTRSTGRSSPGAHLARNSLHRPMDDRLHGRGA